MLRFFDRISLEIWLFSQFFTKYFLDFWLRSESIDLWKVTPDFYFGVGGGTFRRSPPLPMQLITHRILKYLLFRKAESWFKIQSRFS